MSSRNGIGYAVLDVVLEHLAANAIDGGFDGGKLRQHFAAIAVFLHHFANGFQVSDGAREPVDDRLGVGVMVCHVGVPPYIPPGGI